MGRLATLNPRSRQGKRDDPEADAQAALEQMVRSMPDRLAYERWLLQLPAFPGLSLEETRRQVRAQTMPFCPGTSTNLRAARVAEEQRVIQERADREARERLKAERARLIAGASA